MMRKLLIVAVCFALGVSSGYAQTDSLPKVSPEYKAELTKLIDNMGSLKSVDAMMEQLQQQFAGAPNGEAMSGAFGDLIKNLLGELVDMMAPIYEKHISLEDIKAYNKFYESDSGKRIAAAMPKITVEAATVAQMHVMSKVQEAVAKMQAAGQIPQQ